MATIHADGSITLTAAERAKVRMTLADLYFPAKANGPVPMQVRYWDEILDRQEQSLALLDLTEDEIEQQATRAFNRATYGSDEAP